MNEKDNLFCDWPREVALDSLICVGGPSRLVICGPFFFFRGRGREGRLISMKTQFIYTLITGVKEIRNNVRHSYILFKVEIIQELLRTNTKKWYNEYLKIWNRFGNSYFVEVKFTGISLIQKQDKYLSLCTKLFTHFSHIHFSKIPQGVFEPHLFLLTKYSMLQFNNIFFVNITINRSKQNKYIFRMWVRLAYGNEHMWRHNTTIC